jgi:hypothetical protein
MMRCASRILPEALAASPVSVDGGKLAPRGHEIAEFGLGGAETNDHSPSYVIARCSQPPCASSAHCCCSSDY